MQIINEVHDKKGAFYFERIYKGDSGKILGTEDIRFPVYLREDADGNKYFIMYTYDMQPITEAFGFLNQKQESFATRRQAVPALKLLYSYEAIISKQISDFNVADIEAFKDFLSGISYAGVHIQFNLVETRDNGTVNTYLGIYRKYCEYIGVENAALNQKYSHPSHVITGTFADVNAPYRRNKKVAQPKEVPMYISPDEFEKIINVIRAKYTSRDEIIVRLMYDEGFRIGEVLGSTNDDLVEENVKDIGWTNVMYLRNRLSDDEIAQSAKGRMRARVQSDYARKEYNLIGYGYHKVPINPSLAKLIVEYIEEAHMAAREKYGQAYWDCMTADRVRESEKFEEPNFYIFMNLRGGRLTQATWNKTLRSIFRDAGIAVDTGKKKHNLNHRFRHGFAMRLVGAGMRQLELKEQLRHTSLDTVSCYYRPTTADIIRTKKLFEDSIIADVPELAELVKIED